MVGLSGQQVRSPARLDQRCVEAFLAKAPFVVRKRSRVLGHIGPEHRPESFEQGAVLLAAPATSKRLLPLLGSRSGCYAIAGSMLNERA
jgi:hypothetical protein